MARYLTMVEDRLKNLDKWVIRRVPRKENLKADALAEITITLPIREALMLSVHVSFSSSRPLFRVEQVCNPSEIIPSRPR